MWFRTALLLIAGLLLYRFLMDLIRRLSAPSDGHPNVRTSPRQTEVPREAPPPFKPTDVIDVPFRETPPDDRAR